MKLKIINSTPHWVMPRIVTVILMTLLITIVVQGIISCKKAGTPFTNLKSYRLSMSGQDKMKLLGSIFTFIIYIYLMESLTLPPTNITSIFLLSVLFDNERIKRSIIISGIISAGLPVFI